MGQNPKNMIGLILMAIAVSTSVAKKEEQVDVTDLGSFIDKMDAAPTFTAAVQVILSAQGKLSKEEALALVDYLPSVAQRTNPTDCEVISGTAQVLESISA